MIPSNPVFVNQRKSDPHAYQKNRDDKSGKRKPKGIFNDIDGDEPEMIKVEKQVKKNHQDNGKAP